MPLRPTPTGDSFFDPPPSDQSAATLILGGERLECHLVEVSIGGFGVSVPRSTAWTGEPVCKLLTHDAAYPVRIIRQESQYTGYHLTLQRIQEEETNPDESPGAAQRWIIHTSRCCVIGLIAVIAYCFLAAPGGSSQDARRIRPRDVANLWKWTEFSIPWWPANRDTAASDSELTALTTTHSEPSDDLFEMPAISISLTSNDRGTNVGANVSGLPVPSPPRAAGPSSHSTDADPQAQAIAAATRLAQIKSSLHTARRGSSRPANSTSLPWLFPANEPALHNGLTFLMSEAARNDLTLFESGLKSLSATSANEATRSLRRTLLAATLESASAVHFESLPDVRLIRSDDAEIYFRLANGAVEILRVVPRDIGDPGGPARATSPTSSLTPHSVNR